MTVRLAIAGAVLLIGTMAAPMPAAGQAVPARAPGPARVEVALGADWSGSADLGGNAASLTPNLNGSAFTLFKADAALSSPIGGDLRIGYRVTPWLLVGVSAALSRGDVTVHVGGDAEDGGTTSFAGESLGQGLIEGRIDVILPRYRFWRSRITPYLMTSAGVMRHWHEGNVLIESGQVVQAGGGVRYGLRYWPKSRLSRLGLSAEMRVTRVSGGFHWGREHRTVPSLRLECYTGWGR